MSGQRDFDEEESSRRTFAAPYTSHHPIPTVQRYRAHQGELETHKKEQEEAFDNEGDEGKVQRAVDSVKKIFTGQDNKHVAGESYPTENRNFHSTEPSAKETENQKPSPPAKDDKPQKAGQNGTSATEMNAAETDPRQKRKNMKHAKRDDGGREVTDPITHLPVVIYDSTDRRLQKAPENEPAAGSQQKSATGLSGASKSKSQLDLETQEAHDEHIGMQKAFPPPSFDDTQAELKRTYQFALTVGLSSIATFATLVLIVWQLLSLKGQEKVGSSSLGRVFMPVFITVVLSLVISSFIILGIRGWLGKKVEEIWQDEIWDADRLKENEEVSKSSMPESTQWLNSLFASVWPLINPDLFLSLADMLEDVMQASLPKMVRMVSVDDLGQGSESFRVLGVKWLPTGAASQSVDVDGNLKPAKGQETSDRVSPGEGEVDSDEMTDKKDNNASDDKDEESKKKQQEEQTKQQEQQAMAEGLEAEQGMSFLSHLL